MPQKVKDILPLNMDITVDKYRKFWWKAKETTSYYPAGLSFATLKAGVKSDRITALECKLTNIPLKSGYTPKRWRKCMDVMILKNPESLCLADLGQ
jgi:hypothetical protein